MGCLVAKPVVNGIEKDLRGTAEMIRLDLMSPVGAEAADRYAVGAVPTLVVLDGTGEMVYRRSGMPDREEIVTRVRGL